MAISREDSQTPKPAALKISDSGYEETFYVAIEGESDIELWWDGMLSDCPEDLVWRREISTLAKSAYALGVRVGKGEISPIEGLEKG